MTATDVGVVREIPLDKLKASPDNARRTDVEAGVAELAASIAAHGLLQMPLVAPELDGEGNETGFFHVTAGERRRKALRLLAKQKRLKKTALIRCLVRTDGSPAELSLVENAVRRDMHPADQFEAFARLHQEQGLGPEEIAARFGTTAAVVKQRLKLAAVSPALMARYREGEMMLDQLMAFTLTDDHHRQEAWERLSWNKSPEMIRRLLTEGKVSSRDRRARFVGLPAYEAAGGVVLRYLFAEDHGGWLSDPALLERLLKEKLEAAAEEVRREGFRWVEAHPEYPHGRVAGLRRVYPKAVPLPQEAHARLEALTARYDELAARYGEGDVPEDVAAEIEAVDAEVGALQSRTRAYLPEEVAIAGAIVSVGQDGELRIERGFVRREDEPRPQEDVAAGAPSSDAPEAPWEPKGLRPLPDPLLAELSAHRTAALQACLAGRADVALAALAHALALRVFYNRGIGYDPGTCLSIEAAPIDLGRIAPSAQEGKAGQELAQCHAEWAGRLPQEPEALFGWALAQDAGTLLPLLAYCVARTVDVVRQAGVGVRGLRHADALAQALALDMAAWWAPTRENYLGRVPKARILEAVREGVSEKDAESIAILKKDAMAEHAERLLAGKGWLPEALRTPTAVAGQAMEPEAAE